MRLHFIEQKKTTNKKRQIEKIEGREKFETHYAEAQKKFAVDENVTFSFRVFTFLLKKENILLLPINPVNTEQLKLLQKDHL